MNYETQCNLSREARERYQQNKAVVSATVWHKEAVAAERRRHEAALESLAAEYEDRVAEAAAQLAQEDPFSGSYNFQQAICQVVLATAPKKIVCGGQTVAINGGTAEECRTCGTITAIAKPYGGQK